MSCLARSIVTVRPSRPVRANVRAAARKNPSGAIAAGLAAAVLLATSPAQAGLFDGLLQGGDGGAQDRKSSSGGGLPSTSEALGNGPPPTPQDPIAKAKSGGVKDPTNTAEEVGPIPQGPDAPK